MRGDVIVSVIAAVSAIGGGGRNDARAMSTTRRRANNGRCAKYAREGMRGVDGRSMIDRLIRRYFNAKNDSRRNREANRCLRHRFVEPFDEFGGLFANGL